MSDGEKYTQLLTTNTVDNIYIMRQQSWYERPGEHRRKAWGTLHLPSNIMANYISSEWLNVFLTTKMWKKLTMWENSRRTCEVRGANAGGLYSMQYFLNIINCISSEWLNVFLTTKMWKKMMMWENRRRTCEVRGAKAGALFHQPQNCQKYLAHTGPGLEFVNYFTQAHCQETWKFTQNARTSH